MKELTPVLIAELAKKHLTLGELEWVGTALLRNPKGVSAMAQVEQHTFASEEEVAEWLKRLAQAAIQGGDA